MHSTIWYYIYCWIRIEKKVGDEFIETFHLHNLFRQQSKTIVQKTKKDVTWWRIAESGILSKHTIEEFQTEIIENFWRSARVILKHLFHELIDIFTYDINTLDLRQSKVMPILKWEERNENSLAEFDASISNELILLTAASNLFNLSWSLP
jgi:hypothetical protein